MKISHLQTAIGLAAVGIAFGVRQLGAEAAPAAPSSPPVAAPLTPALQERWNQIRAADTRIEACRVAWKRVLFIKPKRNVDVEKRAARAAEQARLKGASAAEIAERTQRERKSALEDQKGHQITSALSIVRIGGTVRCELVDGQPESGMIDYYDGKNVVQLFQEDDKRDWDGVLLRDDKEILSHTLTGWLLPQFLTGLPLSKQFPASWTFFAPPESAPREASAGTFVMEKTSELEPGLPTIHRLSVAKEHLRPVSYELMNTLCAEGDPDRIIGRAVASDYRKYADGVWFPAKVTVETKVMKIEYTLVKAEFNEAVDPMELRLPPNTRMADSRFGLGKSTVSYKLKNGVVPPDDEIRGMLGQKPGKTEARLPAAKVQDVETVESAPHSSSSPLAPLFGLALMTCGCVLWGRSRSHDA